MTVVQDKNNCNVASARGPPAANRSQQPVPEPRSRSRLFQPQLPYLDGALARTCFSIAFIVDGETFYWVFSCSRSGSGRGG
jgi:hypothetical protein